MQNNSQNGSDSITQTSFKRAGWTGTFSVDSLRKKSNFIAGKNQSSL